MNLAQACDLTGRVAIVTGASRGLGREAALALAAVGADVAITGRRQEPLDALAADVAALGGGRGLALVLDVNDQAAIQDAIARVSAEFGAPAILVNNAGIEVQALLTDLAPGDWERVLQTNLGAVIACCQAFVRACPPAGGSIINFSSVAAQSGLVGQAAYTASKGGVESLTRALAVELARRSIRVNAIAPGYFATDMSLAVTADPAQKTKLLKRVPLRRLGEPWEIGPLVAYLASDASAFMTGSTIALDGGFGAR
jgi:NAD(P)-dependent dehydrogenase (short-subunit alcohol dehydrogenase family)